MDDKKPEDKSETTEPISQENKLDSNTVEEDKSSKGDLIELLDTSNEEIIDKEYLLIRKLLDIDLSNFFTRNLHSTLAHYEKLI